MLKPTTIALALALFTAQGLPASAGQSVSATQLRSLFPGSFKVVVSGVVPLRMTAHRSGRLTGKMGGETDKGHWSVRGGILCIALNKWLDGKSRCARVTKKGKWYRAKSVRFTKL